MKNSSIDQIFNKCVAALESELDFYIQDKNDDEEGVQCCSPYTWHRGFHDRTVTGDKLQLIKDLRYTLQVISQDFDKEIKSLFQDKFKGEEDLLANASYRYTTKAYGRIWIALECAKTRADEIIEGKVASSGRLGTSLTKCCRIFDNKWEETKTRIINTPVYQGRIFFPGIDEITLKNKFDRDCQSEGRVFSKLMACPKDVQVTDAIPPVFNAPPAYEENNFLLAEAEKNGSLLVKPTVN